MLFHLESLEEKKQIVNMREQNWITEIIMTLINESQHEKTRLRGFRPCKTQTKLQLLGAVTEIS